MASPNTSFRWDMFQTRDDLVAFTELLGKLDALMAEERAAVAKLDSKGLDDISERKQAVANDLAAMQDRARQSAADGSAAKSRTTDPELIRVKRAAAIAAQRVAASAQANAMLLADAVGSIASMLGLSRNETSTTYDRNARRTGSRPRNRPGRAA